jgi:hypothetical protein
LFHALSDPNSRENRHVLSQITRKEAVLFSLNFLLQPLAIISERWFRTDNVCNHHRS